MSGILQVLIGSGGLGNFVASASPASATGSESGLTGTRLVTSNSVTVSTTGGTGGGKTYSWARISGDSSITAGSPLSASTTFSATIAATAGNTTIINAVFRCTVNDGTYIATVDVPVQLSYQNLS